MPRLPESPTPWLAALAGLLAASFLMAYYVNLLQESVARGNQSRYTQQHAPATPAAKQLATATRDAS